MIRTVHTLVIVRGREQFVLRADPWNRRTIPWLEFIERLVRRDFRWVLCVRRWDDDPFGAVCHEETVPSRRDVGGAMTRIEADVQEGRVCSRGSDGKSY